MAQTAKFYEFFPYEISRKKQKVRFIKSLMTWQTCFAFLAFFVTTSITFVDSYPILKQNNVPLYLIYLIRRMSFVASLIVSYFSVVLQKRSARILLKIFKIVEDSRRYKRPISWAIVDSTFVSVMVVGVLLQEKGNITGMSGHVKIASNFFMNLFVYCSLAYFRRVMIVLEHGFLNIDMTAGPRKISRRYYALYRGSTAALNVFAVSILCSLTVCGVYLNSNVLYIFGNRRKVWAQYGISTAYSIYYGFIVVEVIVRSCSRVANAGNRATHLMMEKILTSQDAATVNLLRLHSSLYRKLEFRPLGLFEVSNQFLTQFFAVLFSYASIILAYLDQLHN